MKIGKQKLAVVLIILGACFIALYFSVTALHKNGFNKKTEGDAQSSSVLPHSEPQYFVVIDAGHGGRDHGASGTDSGVFEDVLNLDTAKKVKAALLQKNIAVMLTRETDDALAKTKKDDMKERRRIMHETGADLTVSIHMNKYTDRSVHGPMVFYTKADERSCELSECILKSICDKCGLPKRLPNTGDYYVIRDSKIPAVIVECGFLSNPDDEKLLCDETYRQKIADAIADGIETFLNNA